MKDKAPKRGILKRPKLTITGRSAMAGRMFLLPFYLGFLFFFLNPMIQSLTFIFHSVTLQPGYFEMEWTGLKNIVYLFTEDPEFNKNLAASCLQMLYQVPVVLIAALFFAIIVNQKFKGRTLVRAIFFLPVIITSGVVMSIIKGDAFATNLITASEGMQTNISATSFGLQELLISIGMSSTVVDYFTTVSGSLFDLLWRTGIQMIIFLAGLQTISPALYEASSIEGASAWENFWMVTIPMITPMIVVNLVYTVIDSFTDSTNAVMMMVAEAGRAQKFANAAAMSWVYFLIVGAVLGIMALIYSLANRKNT